MIEDFGHVTYQQLSLTVDPPFRSVYLYVSGSLYLSPNFCGLELRVEGPRKWWQVQSCTPSCPEGPWEDVQPREKLDAINDAASHPTSLSDSLLPVLSGTQDWHLFQSKALHILSTELAIYTSGCSTIALALGMVTRLPSTPSVQFHHLKMTPEYGNLQERLVD